jgi:hypothetical protein
MLDVPTISERVEEPVGKYPKNKTLPEALTLIILFGF